MYWHDGELLTWHEVVIDPSSLISYDYTHEYCIGYTNDGMISHIDHFKPSDFTPIYAPDALDVYLLESRQVIVVYTDRLEVYSPRGVLTSTINETIHPDFKLFKGRQDFHYMNNGILYYCDGTIKSVPHDCKYLMNVYEGAMSYVDNNNILRNVENIPLTPIQCTDQIEVLYNRAYGVVVLHCQWSGNTTSVYGFGLEDDIINSTFETNGYHWMVHIPDDESYYCAGGVSFSSIPGSTLFKAGRHVRSVPTKSARS